MARDVTTRRVKTVPRKTATGKATAAPRPGPAIGSKLSEKAIIKVGRQIIKESGVDGLTMRRLSDELGVALGATYVHVANRDTLLGLVATSVQEEVKLPDGDVGDWLARMRVLLLNYISVVSRYEGLAAFILSHPRSVPDRVHKTMRGYLDEAGFSDEGAQTVLASVFFYVAGSMVSGLAAPKTRGGQRRARLNTRCEDGLDILLKGVWVELNDDRQRRR